MYSDNTAAVAQREREQKRMSHSWSRPGKSVWYVGGGQTFAEKEGRKEAFIHVCVIAPKGKKEIISLGARRRRLSSLLLPPLSFPPAHKEGERECVIGYICRKKRESEKWRNTVREKEPCGELWNNICTTDTATRERKRKTNVATAASQGNSSFVLYRKWHRLLTASPSLHMLRADRINKHCA